MNERQMIQFFQQVVEDLEMAIWISLCIDVHQSGLHAEFAEFILESPGLHLSEIDRQFRNEYNI